MGKQSKHQRLITYNLTHASSRAVFEESLNHDEFELSDNIAGHSRGGTASQAQAKLLQERNRRVSLAPGFHTLSTKGEEDEGDAEEYQLTSSDEGKIGDLLQLFSMHSMETVKSVYLSCDRSFDSALQVLSDMTVNLENNPEAHGGVDHGASSSHAISNALDGDGLGGSLSPLWGGVPAAIINPEGVCWWDKLHESLREAVLSHLSARDLARVAWTCKDFAWRVRNGRINARSLVIPTGVTLSGILGMVAGHPNARAISLVRWGASQLRDADFSALVSAVAQGSCSSRRNVRVEAVSLRGWTSASDSNLINMLDTLQHLRELDLSDCSSLTDAALGPIARYQRAVPETQDDPPGALDQPPGRRSPAAGGGSSNWEGTPLSAWGTHPAAHWGPGGLGMSMSGRSARITGLSGASFGSEGGTMDAVAAAASAGPSASPIAVSVGSAGGAWGVRGNVPGAGAGDAGRASGGGVVTPGMPRRTGGGVPGGSSDDEESVAGGSDADEDDFDSGVVLDEEIPAREKAEEERRRRRAAAAASARPPPAPSATTPPPRLSTSPAPPLAASGSVYGLSPGRVGIYGSSPLGGGSALPGSIHRHGHATLRGASPTPQNGWLGGNCISSGRSGVPGGASPPLGTSPPINGGGGGSSLGKAGSLGSLGKTLFGKFGSARGGGGSGTPTPGGAGAWGILDAAGVGVVAGGSVLGVGVSTAPMVALGTGPKGLEVLCLAGCSGLGPEGVRTLLNTSLVKQSLQALDLSRCMRITRAALVLPPSSSLRVLRAAECQNLHEVVMQLPLNSPLQELWLNNCKQLSRVHIVGPRLTLLHVGGCKTLNSVQLRCPRLTQLLANLCFRLCDVEPDQVSLPALEEINLFGCRQLGAPGLTALVRGSPNLAMINLNGCNTLTEVVMQDHLNLRTLDVSGCRVLESLRCASPVMTSVMARACHRLWQVQLDSTQLQQLDLTNCSALREVLTPALPMAVTSLRADPLLEDILSAAAIRARGAGPHPSQSRLIAQAAQAARLSLAIAGATPPVARAVGCDGLAPLTLLALRVLKAAAALPAPARPAGAAAAAAAVAAAAPGVPVPEVPVVTASVAATDATVPAVPAAEAGAAGDVRTAAEAAGAAAAARAVAAGLSVGPAVVQQGAITTAAVAVDEAASVV